MGIKGIYGEVGPGERVALAKLAVEHFEKTERPLRVAIDIAIWQFQIQAGRGGTNPAIRTFYFRLLRLLSLPIQPLFVFDGPHKPTFKRNKRVSANAASLPNAASKQLLKLFGFPFHIAPGEAEAECALLQREGIVDAVLSEDVDTLMFGCGVTLRNWSPEGSRGNKAPTHVSVYEAEATKKGKSGLDREGMILVALMSGGDYITAGIPGCGIKVACEAARAGFGKSLCRVSRSDPAAMDVWRQNLTHEVQTNESKFFRIKHKALKIPENFPDREVLGYYTHPVVSSASKIARLKIEITWDESIDIPGLRQWTSDTFDWKYKSGARKFIRGLAPVLLVHKLLRRADRRDSGYGDLILTADNEMELVRSICGKRIHFSSDGIPEMRVIYHPIDIVGLDLDTEEEPDYDNREDYGRDGLAPELDDDAVEPYISDEAIPGDRSNSPTKRAASRYDPTQPDKLWMPATIVKIGVPLKAEDYEESLRDPKLFLKQKAAEKRAAKKRGGMPAGAMDKFVKITKPTGGDITTSIPDLHSKSVPPPQAQLPPVYLAPLLDVARSSSQPAMVDTNTSFTRRSVRSKGSSTTAKPGPAQARTTTKSKAAGVPKRSGNPWTISQATGSSESMPSMTKPISRTAIQSKAGLTRSYQPTPEPSVISLLSSPSSQGSPDVMLQRCSSRSPIDTATPLRKRKSPSPSTNRDFLGRLEDEEDSLLVEESAPDRRLHYSQRTVNGREVAGPKSTLVGHEPPEVFNMEETRPKQAVQTINNRSKGKYYMPRDSLPGAWKIIDQDMEEEGRGRGRGRGWRVSGVEMVDLTEA